MRTIVTRLACAAALSIAVTGCREASPTHPDIEVPAASAVKFWDAAATTTWHDRAGELLAELPNGSHAPASRILTYLSIAQYRVVLAAEAGKERAEHASVPAAVGAASVVVLGSFFPAHAAHLQDMLEADLAEPQWPGSAHRNIAAGDALGRAVATDVLALAATDNFGATDPGIPPIGPGFWVWNGAPIVRSLHGVRPFFLPSGDALRSPPPPAFDSPAFLEALTEVRTISDTRTPEQLAIAEEMNQREAPFTPGQWNALAVALIRKHHRTEREAARILAFANAATFDAQIACWDTKIAYWFIRPSHADPAITLPIGLPNHPSYPSGHSCITSAYLNVLKQAFPRESAMLDSNIELAGLSRVYAGIHYRFDIDAGQDIGRRAAELALAGSLK